MNESLVGYNIGFAMLVSRFKASRHFAASILTAAGDLGSDTNVPELRSSLSILTTVPDEASASAGSAKVGFWFVFSSVLWIAGAVIGDWTRCLYLRIPKLLSPGISDIHHRACTALPLLGLQ